MIIMQQFQWLSIAVLYIPQAKRRLARHIGEIGHGRAGQHEGQRLVAERQRDRHALEQRRDAERDLQQHQQPMRGSQPWTPAKPPLRDWRQSSTADIGDDHIGDACGG